MKHIMVDFVRLTRIVDDANKAANQLLAQYMANNRIEKSVCYLDVSYYPDGSDTFHFSRPIRGDYARSPQDLDRVAYSNLRGDGARRVAIWQGATSVYHAAGTPRDHLVVVLAKRAFELRTLEDAERLRKLRNEGDNALLPLTFWER